MIGVCRLRGCEGTQGHVAEFLEYWHKVFQVWIVKFLIQNQLDTCNLLSCQFIAHRVSPIQLLREIKEVRYRIATQHLSWLHLCADGGANVVAKMGHPA